MRYLFVLLFFWLAIILRKISSSVKMLIGTIAIVSSILQKVTGFSNLRYPELFLKKHLILTMKLD